MFSLPCVPSFDKKWKVTKFCLYVDQTQLSVYMLNINCLLTSIHDQDGETAMGQIDNLGENSLNDLYKSSLNYFFKDMNGDHDQFPEFYTCRS